MDTVDHCGTGRTLLELCQVGEERRTNVDDRQVREPKIASGPREEWVVGCGGEGREGDNAADSSFNCSRWEGAQYHVRKMQSQ